MFNFVLSTFFNVATREVKNDLCGSYLWLAFYFYWTVLVWRALNNKLKS